MNELRKEVEESLSLRKVLQNIDNQQVTQIVPSSYVEATNFDMIKKICLEEIPNLYPRDLDLARRWHLKFYAKGLKFPINVFLSKKAKTFEQKLDEAEKINVEYQSKGYSTTSVFIRSEVVQKTACQKLIKKVEGRVGLKIKSVQSYASHIRNLDRYMIKENYAVITEGVLVSFCEYMKREGKSNETINNHRRTFITHLGLVAKKIKKLPRSSKAKPYFTLTELSEIKNYMSINIRRLILPCAIVYWCAVRTGNELRNIQVKDVDMNLGRLWITEESSKTNKRESIQIPPVLFAELKAMQLECYPPQYFLCSHNGRVGKKMVSRDYFSRLFSNMLYDMDFDKRGLKFSMYPLKNSFAVHAYMQGYKIKELQAHFRHKDLKTTDIYLSSLGLYESENFDRMEGF
jgi:integrase